jgi:hypothetical protein
MQLRTVVPTFVVDITVRFETWMSALKAHATRFENPDKARDYVWSLETMARHCGSLVGVQYGQGFVAGEAVNVHDPLTLAGV